jgi:rhodanese-related sulfurtransferase
VKKITTAIVLASTLLAGCSSSSSATDLDSQAFANKISEPGVVILDVRTSAEFAAGHIEGAINIDVEGMQFESGIAELDKGATIAVYCQSGRRSGIAVDKMSEAGFTSLFNLQTGIADWQANGFPVTL